MQHSFNCELAEEIGIEKAILLQNIFFWIQKNEACNKHHIDNKTWTYNSSAAFGALFKYMNEKSISRYLTQLENDGYLVSGNHNKSAYDRTKWYSVGENGLKWKEIIAPSIRHSNISISQNEKSITQNEEPIPDSKPQIIKTDTDTAYMSDSHNFKKIDTLEIDEAILFAFGSKKVWTRGALDKLRSRLKVYSESQIAAAFRNLQNEPDLWKIKYNGFRPLAWWLHNDDRIEDMLHCHEKQIFNKNARPFVMDDTGGIAF